MRAEQAAISEEDTELKTSHLQPPGKHAKLGKKPDVLKSDGLPPGSTSRTHEKHAPYNFMVDMPVQRYVMSRLNSSAGSDSSGAEPFAEPFASQLSVRSQGPDLPFGHVDSAVSAAALDASGAKRGPLVAQLMTTCQSAWTTTGSTKVTQVQPLKHGEKGASSKPPTFGEKLSGLFGVRTSQRAGPRRGSRMSMQSTATALYKGLKIGCTPVEGFSDDMPHCKTLQDWAFTCALFIVDPREEDAWDPISQRRAELGFQVRKTFKEPDVSAKMPPLLAAVLVHAGSRAPSRGHGDEPEGEFGRLIAGLKELNPNPAHAHRSIHYPCDFDDPDSLICCLMRIASDILQAQAYATESTPSEPAEGRRCCCTCQ